VAVGRLTDDGETYWCGLVDSRGTLEVIKCTSIWILCVRAESLSELYCYYVVAVREATMVNIEKLRTSGLVIA